MFRVFQGIVGVEIELISPEPMSPGLPSDDDESTFSYQKSQRSGDAGSSKSGGAVKQIGFGCEHKSEENSPDTDPNYADIAIFSDSLGSTDTLEEVGIILPNEGKKDVGVGDYSFIGCSDIGTLTADEIWEQFATDSNLTSSYSIAKKRNEQVESTDGEKNSHSEGEVSISDSDIPDNNSHDSPGIVAAETSDKSPRRPGVEPIPSLHKGKESSVHHLEGSTSSSASDNEYAKDNLEPEISQRESHSNKLKVVDDSRVINETRTKECELEEVDELLKDLEITDSDLKQSQQEDQQKKSGIPLLIRTKVPKCSE